MSLPTYEDPRQQRATIVPAEIWGLPRSVVLVRGEMTGTGARKSQESTAHAVLDRPIGEHVIVSCQANVDWVHSLLVFFDSTSTALSPCPLQLPR